MKQYIINIFKGAAMGAANVIPGVSGGTIALITGIFERLINAIKSFNITAIKILLKGDFKEFAKHVDLAFLISVFIGVGVSIISFAKLLGYLFENYPIHIWAYFFGLILASVYFVGKRVDNWNLSSIVSIIFGVAMAIGISILTPASENDGLIYLFICGAIAACSMILPGLSGSFVLILLGNYQLVMIDAVNEFNISILTPVVVGAGFGLLAFSYILSWVFKKYKNQTIALLTGFIAGSLAILWPWKETVTTIIDRHGETIPLKQSNVFPWNYTEITNNESHFIFAVILMVIGFISIWILEKYAEKQEK